MKRKFKRVLFHDAGEMVMFEMENGWYYDVDFRKNKIFVFWLPDFYTRFCPYVEEKVPEDVKRNAIKALDTMPLETAMVGDMYREKYGPKYIEGKPNIDRKRLREEGLAE